jgi:uncharacterized protein
MHAHHARSSPGTSTQLEPGLSTLNAQLSILFLVNCDNNLISNTTNRFQHRTRRPVNIMDSNFGILSPMTENEILKLVENDPWMMDVISHAEELSIPNWVIGAGFLRNKIWDHLHGYSRKETENADIDLVYFDPNGNNQEQDEALSLEMKEKTGFNFEIVNQVYAHVWNGIPPYVSVEDAISQWPETATAIGITKKDEVLKLVAPYGIEDVVNLIIRQSPNFKSTALKSEGLIENRVRDKRWLEKYPKLRVTIS